LAAAGAALGSPCPCALNCVEAVAGVAALVEVDVAAEGVAADEARADEGEPMGAAAATGCTTTGRAFSSASSCSMRASMASSFLATAGGICSSAAALGGFGLAAPSLAVCARQRLGSITARAQQAICNFTDATNLDIKSLPLYFHAHHTRVV
jgi:hypothetical protein